MLTRQVSSTYFGHLKHPQYSPVGWKYYLQWRSDQNETQHGLHQTSRKSFLKLALRYLYPSSSAVVPRRLMPHFQKKKDWDDFIQNVPKRVAGGVKKKKSHMFCYRGFQVILEKSALLSAVIVRWTTLSLYNFPVFLLFPWVGCTHLIPAQWHRWSPRTPRRSSLTSAGANCRTALKWDSPSPAGKETKHPTWCQSQLQL